MSRGNIRQRSKRSWTLTVELPREPETGKRRQAYETVKGTKKDAERRLSELQAKVDKGEFANPTAMTVAEYLTFWAEGHVATTKRATTSAGYRWYVGKYIIPSLGKSKLKDLQPAHLEKLYAQLLGRGLGARTVKHAHTILHTALVHAVKGGLLARNIAGAVTPPRPKRRDASSMSAEEVQRFLNAAIDTLYYIVFLTALWTGARRSEVLGLRWRDIDLTMGTMSVPRAMHVLKGAKMVFEEPKSSYGKRSIAMPPSLSLALRQHRRQMESILGPRSDDDLVFTWEDGRPMRPNSVTHAFKRIARRVGLEDVSLHDSRHTHASLLLKQGVHPKIVQERLGHSSIGITLDLYSHVAPGLQEAAAKAFDDALSDAIPVVPGDHTSERVPLTNG